MARELVWLEAVENAVSRPEGQNDRRQRDGGACLSPIGLAIGVAVNRATKSSLKKVSSPDWDSNCQQTG
jgi:hypothetical protein